MKKKISLANLLAGQNIISVINNNNMSEIEISGVNFDSRKIKPGDIFVAFSGENFDGHKYIKKAISKGAAAVICEKLKYSNEVEVPLIIVKNSRKFMAQIAANFYGNPSEKMITVGVTGTDGKTSTCEIIYSILKESGLKVGIISTLGAKIGDNLINTGLHTTTPNSILLQYLLAKMVEQNIKIAILEISSHGLSQYRAEAINFDIAVVTNLSPEHLDYHKNLEDYRSAKAILLDYVINSKQKTDLIPKTIILNKDDKNFSFFSQFKTKNDLSFSTVKDADYRANNIIQKIEGIEFILETKVSSHKIISDLSGLHNIKNLLAAIAVCRTINLSWEKIISGIENIHCIFGRLDEIVFDDVNFKIFVDFAHTPQALLNVLKTVNKFTNGRIHLVFGCPGLRDQEKRIPMGEISADFADKIYITADDPRTEPVMGIINQIAIGCIRRNKKEGLGFYKIPDRREAIKKAISRAVKDDVVLCCGKGHEKTMAIGSNELPWDEYQVIQNILKEINFE